MLPAFVSLVGVESETDEIFKLLGPMLPQAFPDQTCRVFEDVVADWSRLRIEGTRKRDLIPAARFLMRWGLFSQNIETTIKPAFQQGVTVGVTRKFGFDIVAGALAGKQCDLTLQLHWPLVDAVIKQRGLPPPVYVFTSEPTGPISEAMARYFNPVTGQRHRKAPFHWNATQKAGFIVRVLEEEMARPSQTKAA